MKKRLLSMLLCLTMVLSFMPTSAFAQGEAAGPQQEQNEQNNSENVINQSGNTQETAVLTLLLPGGLSAEGMEQVDEDTYKVTSAAGEDGNITPVVISSEDEGAFSAELGGWLNENVSFTENGLTATCGSEGDTLTISGSPAKSVELDMNAILTAAMEAMGQYDAAPAEDVHTHCVCGSTTCTETTGGHTGQSTWTAWNNTDSLPTEEGNYYLTGNVTLSNTWSCDKNVQLCLAGKNITGPGGGEVIKVESNGSLTITDCTTESTGVGKITHAEGAKGCGVSNAGTLTLWNGSISGNTTSYQGGGVNNGGTFTMNGGSISGNTTGFFGGGGVYNYRTFTMNGGTINDNKAENNGGGVSNNYEYATFTMTGGSITGNTVDGSGGGVYNSDGYYREGYGTKFIMTGGSITGNTAVWGGGGVENNVATFTMSGTATISGNTTTNGDGGGVYNRGGFTVSGDVTISGNKRGGTFNEEGTLIGGTENNVCEVIIYEAFHVTVDPDKPLTEKASVGITGQSPADGRTVITGTTDTTGFFSDNADYKLVDNGETGLKLSLLPHTHRVCNDSACKDTTHDITWKAWESTTDLPSEAGNYYLVNDITLNASWVVSADITLCLDGKTITGKDSAYVIEVSKSASLIITDCQKVVGKITNNTERGRGIQNSGTLILWNGTITGTALGVYNYGTFTMNGGSITGNYAPKTASGVLNSKYDSSAPIFKLSGNVNISDNKGGNVKLYDETTITVEEGKPLAETARVGISGTAGSTVVTGTTSNVGFFSDDGAYDLVPNDSNNGLKLAKCTASEKLAHNDTHHWYKCSNAGCEKKYNEVAHTYDQEVASDSYLKSAATCTAEAVYYKSCICGAKGTETFTGGKDANNHSGTAVWTQTATTHEKKWDCCHVVAVASEPHEWENGECGECSYVCLHSGGTATCKDKAVCSTCGATYGNVDASNHGTNLKHVEAKAATETTEGNIEYWHCEGCDKYYADQDAKTEITKKDTITTRSAVPATSLTLSTKEQTLVLNKTTPLSATVTPANTTDSVTWSSSDPAVVTVSNNGEVKAVGYGTAVITAKAGDKTATCKITVVCGTDECQYYDDIEAKEWYHPAVDYVTKAKIMQGHDTGDFAPDGQLTRAEMAQILYNYEKAVVNNGKEPENGKTTINFSDVKKGEWYEKAIAWASSNDIIEGDGVWDGNTFRPDDSVSREEMVTMLYRYMVKFSEKLPLPASGAEEWKDFPDSKNVADWAETAFAWAVHYGIINGDDGNLNPQSTATRAQAAKIVMVAVKQ